MLESRDRLFIGGDWVTPAGAETIEVVSPATEEVIAHAPDSTPADVDRAVAAARATFDGGSWPNLPPSERAEIMSRISQLLLARSEEIAHCITEENGTPIAVSVMAHVLSATMVLDFYAGLAREFCVEEERAGVLSPALVRREPVGVVGAIVPWNYPLFITMLKFAPAMAAGCTVVLKPAPETPLDAFILAEVAQEAGLPPGVLNIVPAGREVGEHLVTHPGVDKISFTGSTSAGKRVASLCAEQLKRVTLELGGKSAAIVLDDVDIPSVVPGLVGLATMNSGQTCVAQTRVLAPRAHYDEIVDVLVEEARKLKVGPPLDPETIIGPLVARRQRDRVEGYIALGQEEGAKIAIGGGRPADLDRGWYVEPTVFVGVDNSMRIAQEEIFGPVLVVIPYSDTHEAVAIANDSIYGLSGTVWSADRSRAIDVARRVRTGTCTVNGFLLDWGAPFGGFKQSGIGRELGPEGLDEYVELKSVTLPGS